MFAKSWQVKIGTCIALTGTLCIAISGGVLAQIVPDNTLGEESSVVTPDFIRGIESDRIDGGATRGANLFHSFEQFNIGAERGAYFSSPSGIENIFSRVTGANSSEILGRLGVLGIGNANLFLINPRGIVFGSEASLDVQGSFIATTADAVKLGDTGLFSATQPEASNLLTVSPSAILFNTIAAQPIINRSQAQSSIGQPNSDGDSPGLQVQPSRTLGLIGGDVLIEGGKLTTAEGRIELGSVAGVGQVSLTPNEKGFVLGYDSINDFGNISLSNEAFVDASGEGGGDVQIRGARLEMSQSSNIWADTMGAENGGEVLIRTTEVVLGEDSFLRANVASTGTGTGGNLTIDTSRLVVQGGAEVSATTSGEGKGGNLQINADESVEVTGESPNRHVSSGLLAQSEGGRGDAGNLTIVTGRLLVSDGSLISAATFGEGKGGNLQINVDDSVELIGTSANCEFASGLFATSLGSGDAGNVTIKTGRLLLQDGAQISAVTEGEGKGGNLQINADDSVEMVGTSTNREFASGLFATSLGSGDAGNVTIDTRRLLLQGGAQVSAVTEGEGKGGNLQINADDSVEMVGESANSESVSGLFATSLGSGDAGNVTIKTGRLLLQDGAQISLTTSGEGKGGDLQINADDSVEMVGESANSESVSGLFATSLGSGDAGNVTIDTGRLLLQDGAQVSAITEGEGKGGNLQIIARDSVELIGTTANGQVTSNLSVRSNGSGDAGNLTIETGRLLVQGGAVISSRSSGEGTSGNIDITARETLQADDGTISTSTSRSRGGEIAIKAGNIRLVGDSDITSSVASGGDDGGKITLTADSILAFDDSDILAFARDGNGGDINFDTPAFFGENYRPAPSGTNLRGLDKNNQVDINATGAVSGIITIPDVTFIQNSLIELPENQLNTDTILANSCIVRRNQPSRGSFTITGTGSLPQRPGDAQISSFPTVDVATLPRDSTSSNTNPNRSWQKGDPIVKPQGVYRLPNGKLVLSRECS